MVINLSGIASVELSLLKYSNKQGKRGKRMAVQTEEKKLADIQKLRPIDDIFFEVLARNKEVCEEILRTILEDNGLVVDDVITQESERNLFGRSVRLDALCTLSNGTKCNIEVQRANNTDHPRRVRFNASNITVKYSKSGDDFEDVVELYIVYISEFDFLKGGKTIYHVEKVLKETGASIDDGLHEIYVNTAINDGSDIADLMSCFVQQEVKNPKFPKLSAEVTKLKNTEGGVSTMCKVMEESIKREKMDLLFGLVSEETITPEKAAEKLNMSVDELLSEMELYGYKVPELV